MDHRKALDGQAMALMVILCLIWGLQQVVLKAAAADVTPLMQIALRTGIAAVLVGLLMARRGERIHLSDGTWRPGLLVGFFFALEFLLVGEGLRFTTAAHMVVFLYTAPIFVAFGVWLLDEPLEPGFLVGAILVCTGIVLVSGYGWVRTLLGGGR